MDCEKLLRRQPAVDDFSNAMADEERSLRLDRRDEDGVEQVISASNFVARDLHASDVSRGAKTS